MSSPARTWMLVTTIVFGILGLLSLPLALTSFFLFDAPGSEKNPCTIALFISALTMPLNCAASMALSWILNLRQHFTAARWTSLFPVINVFTGAGALLWLEIFNHGSFS